MSAKDPEEIQAALKGLVRAEKESQFAYLVASHRESQEELRSVYEQFAQQRGNFIRQIESRIHELGARTHEEEENLDEDTQPVPGNETEADPIAVEDKMLERYEHALDAGLPRELSEMLEKHMILITEARMHLQDMLSGSRFN